MKAIRIFPNLLVLIIVSILNIGCWCNSGKGKFKSDYGSTIQNRNVGSFEKIDLEGNFIVYLQSDSECSVSVEGDEEIVNMVLTEVENGTLKISYMNQSYPGMENSVTITIKVINLLELFGRKTIGIYSTDVLHIDNLKLDFAGALNMDLEVSGNSVIGQFAGASNVVLSGRVDTLKLEMPGAGKLKAFELLAKNVDLNMAGAGKAEVSVSNQLKVEMAGACYVSYKGKPNEVFSNISGIGRLKRVD